MDSLPANIVIEIVDDVPTAVDDADAVTEDGPLVATGNVITAVDPGPDANATDGVADTVGADGLGSITWAGASGGTVTNPNNYGTLTVDADGNYSYALNNSHAAVQGLDAGQSLTDTFDYTLTDGDGDTSVATLTITINGSNDVPEIVVDPGNPGGANDQVFESGLPNGSAPDPTDVFAYGQFTLSDADGVADVVSVTINGTTVLLADLVG